MLSGKMKSWTDLSQSEDLRKYLPLSSADMYYEFDFDLAFNTKWKSTPTIIEKSDHFKLYSQDIPCWSLTALINVLPSLTLDTSDNHYCRVSTMNRSSEWYDNPVDACVEMIKRLHDLKLMKNGKVRRH